MAPTDAVRTGSRDTTPWFASWFDSAHYHKLYSYRDDAEAAAFIDALIGTLRPHAGVGMLDLGCGAGRHAKQLASKGFQVTGIDLAASSIRDAKRFEQPGLRFLQHDMRSAFGTATFDYVFNLFTSFGYFADPQEHSIVARNMANALRPGGTLVLDYLNVRYAQSHLVGEEVRVIDGVTYRLTRWTGNDAFFKRIVIEDPRSPERLEHIERVARFRLHDFERMFALAGLTIEAVYGDYWLG